LLIAFKTEGEVYGKQSETGGVEVLGAMLPFPCSGAAPNGLGCIWSSGRECCHRERHPPSRVDQRV